MRRHLLLSLLLPLTACDGGAPALSSAAATDDTTADDDVVDTGLDTGAPAAAAPIALPLGETLFFDGDDYLADLGRDAGCLPAVTAAPDGATAEIIADQRITPDVPGEWGLACGDWSATVSVEAAALTEDTFLNYNYTPVSPVAAVGDDTLLVACPTSNMLQVVTLGGGGAAAEVQIPTGAWPTSVAVWGDVAVVTQTGRDTLAFVDLGRQQVVDAIKVGDEPAGVIVDGDAAFVTVSGEDRVIKVDLAARAVVGSAETGNDPRAMALSPDGRRLYVAALLSYNEHRLGTDPTPTEDALRRDITVLDTETMAALHTEPDVGTMLRGMWTDGDRLVVGLSHSRNDQVDVDGDSRPHEHGLAVLSLDADGIPTGDIEQIDLDYREGSAGPAASPFTLAPTPDGSLLVVSLSAGRALLALDAETLAERFRLDTGHDPRGLVVQGGMLWTSAWLDSTVQGFALPLEAGAVAASVEVGADPRGEQLRRGQELFNDAAFSSSGEFSCNNCHIDGVVDGLTWDLLVDGNVNTLAFRNVAGTDPFLWAGLLPTLFDFSREVLKLVGANASGADMEALTVYMQSITAPPSPHTLPGGRLTEAGERGRALFEAGVGEGGAGCAACHSGPLFTSRATVAGKTEGLATDVPGLIAVYDSAPYGRKGHWPTLAEMIDVAVDYTGASALGEAERADLLAYVQQIPGDALWLNGASPLSGDDYVWSQAEVSLTFSAALAAGQADAASLHWIDADGAEHLADGAWEASGRVLRFAPADGELAPETDYVVRVAGGLQARLGQAMAEPLELRWRTGADPDMDISGAFTLTMGLSQVFPDYISYDLSVDCSAIQSSGGNVTLVIHYDDLGVELSHAEGVVVGSRFLLEPFLLHSDFGKVQLEAGYMDMVDLDGDGFADEGEGYIEAFGFEVPLWGVRTALPD